MSQQIARRGGISVLRRFLSSEASGGVLLVGAALLALLVANSAAAGAYDAALHLHLGPLSVVEWINDGLMPVFFLLVGLEIKREWIEGGLSNWSDRRLPIIAALSGMATPALVYLAIAGSLPGLDRGWGIPAATDIAFALGVLALLGKRVPASLKLFLTAVAIIDDVGAIAIVALAYTSEINTLALGFSVVVFAAMLLFGRIGVGRLWPLLVLALLLWAGVLASGVHATIAGVLTALAIPLRRGPGLSDKRKSPLHQLEHAIEPIVGLAILPIFAFANAGVALGGIGAGHLLAPVSLGIAAGLFIGKQAGVLASIYLASAFRIAPRPRGASWSHIYGVALLCGIGFTMSLFIGGLAFSDPILGVQVKIGVLTGSVLSGLAGYAVLRLASRPSG